MAKIKDQKDILEKLGIVGLNRMQENAQEVINSNTEIVLLSPTGTGKTLAFLLPLLQELNPSSTEIQALILVPSRELAIQIEQVTREMGSGYKTNAVYGGRPFSKDKMDLSHRPAILIGTPGRIGDHLRKKTFPVDNIKTLVLDEFDKSLEVGFESEMVEILNALPDLKKKILTSATQQIEIPEFTGVLNPAIVNHLEGEKESLLKIKTLVSPTKDKLDTLKNLLLIVGKKPGIIFCNFKDSIQEVSKFLDLNRIGHGCFYGGMDQQDRERTLIKFRNGTHKLIIATDLAARGLDIPEIEFIIHYQLPLKRPEFTHRNGRTARMHQGGTAYVLQWEKENLPEFIDPATKIFEIGSENEAIASHSTQWETLFISGGRKDKISKGDIAGLFLKQGKLEKEQLGVIELKQDCAFVAVPSQMAGILIQELNNSRLKKKKVRVSII